eukprot:14498691-Alexandrium_andersonii.AAC.1
MGTLPLDLRKTVVGCQGETNDGLAHAVAATLRDLEMATRPLRQPESQGQAVLRGESAGLHLSGGVIEPHQHI